MIRIHLSLVLLLVVIPRSSWAADPQGEAGAISKTFDIKVGRQEILMGPGFEGLSYFPDQPIAILSRKPLTFLTAVGNETVLFGGPNWRDLHLLGKVLQAGGNGSFDNGYAGVGGVFVDGPRVYAFYHAEDQENLESNYSKRNNQRAFIASVGCARSDDGAKTFQKVGQVLTSAHPRKPGAECAGLGDISICLDKTRSYLYAHYSDYSRHADQGVQISVARSPLERKGEPGSWKKYFDGGFDQPGLGGLESHVLSWHSRGGDAYSPSVVFCEGIGKYLMVFCVVDYSEVRLGKESKRPKNSGIYLCDSEDGVQWGEPVQLFASHALLRVGTQDVVHPTLVLDTTKGNVVRGVLLHAYTPNWAEVPHHLAGRTITLSPKKLPLSVTKPDTQNLEQTYLVDLPRTDLREQYGWWSDRGELVLDGSDNPVTRKPLMFDGHHSIHGIYLHARPSGDAWITYTLDKRFSSFRSEAVIPDMLPQQGNPRTPLILKVRGDGRTLWRSRPLVRKGDHQSCTVSVRGVNELSLGVECRGPDNWCLSAWVEPRLSSHGLRQ
jgi:hypothetical protein